MAQGAEAVVHTADQAEPRRFAIGTMYQPIRSSDTARSIKSQSMAQITDS